MARPLASLLDRVRTQDQALLLRHPRLWATRLHIVLIGTLSVYTLVTLFTLFVMRPGLDAQLASLERGESTQYMDNLAVLTDQFRDSVILSIARQTTADTIAAGIRLANTVLLVLGIVAIGVWMRQAGAFGIERVNGKRGRLASVREYLTYALCIALLSGASLWIYLLLQPTTAQYTDAHSVIDDSQRAVRALAIARGRDPKVYLITAPTYGTRHFGFDPSAVANDLAGPSSGASSITGAATHWSAALATLVRSDTTDVNTSSTITIRGDARYVAWMISATTTSLESSRYLERVRASAYVDAFETASGGGTGGISTIMLLPAWLTGLGAYTAYAVKRVSPKLVVSALMIGCAGIPLLLTLGFDVLRLVIFANSTTAGIFDTNGHAVFVIVSMVYTALLAVAVLTALRAIHAPTQRRRYSLAIVMLPALAGIGLYLSMTAITWNVNWPPVGLGLIANPALVHGYRMPVDPTRDLAIVAHSIFNVVLPFTALPLLPLIDRALIRNGSLPAHA